MGKGIFPQSTHTNIQFFSFVLIAIGMPTTKVLMSFGLVFAIANWFLEGRFIEKWQQIKSNQLLQLIIVFYLLLIIGIFWSWDSLQGFKDIKSRLPMLALPLIVATSPLMSVKQVHYLLKLFLAALVFTSIYNILYYNNIIGNISDSDIRGLSRFASHIRYGLLISMGFCICIWFQLSSKKLLLPYSFVALWFFIYSVYSQVLSGIISLVLVIITIIFFVLFHKKKKLAFAFLSVILVGTISMIVIVLNFSHEKVDCSKLPPLTENGNTYTHDCSAFSEINGKAIMTYYSQEEMELEWNKISDIDFMSLDKNGMLLRATAARYMTAINLTKDAKGVHELSKQDIKNIENGYTYPNERNDVIMPRFYGIKYQLINRNNPNGHSLLQRFEHWKASVFIIQKNWLIGVGTGGNDKAFEWAYNELKSPLSEENRKRSHNMYLAYGVNYGVFGIILFLSILILAFVKSWKSKNLLSLGFLVIACGSFLNEDTLETQLGITFFGFFFALLLYSNRLQDVEKHRNPK
mgnify:CR=1 FL=1